MATKEKKPPAVPREHVFGRWPSALRWRGSVIRQIWWKVLLFAGWAAIWTSLYESVPLKINIPTYIVQVLGLVLSLLLVFRTNTAYDRFWEGRRLWSGVVMTVRNMARFIWIGVKEEDSNDAIEKRSAINLLVAFVVATKHYLRAEYGSNHDDLKHYLVHIPKFSTPTAIEREDTATSSLLQKYESGKEARPSNLPLEIIIYLTSYLHHQRRTNKIEPPQFVVMSTTLNNLMESLTGFERILRTPIPLAYSIHLAQCVWIYCIALPFQVVKDLGWVTIPLVAMTAFTMFGIQSIGEEIENPFGYDANDLPLDDFCKVVETEVDVITSTPPPDPVQWIFSEVNLRFLSSAKTNSTAVNQDGNTTKKASHKGTTAMESVIVVNTTESPPIPDVQLKIN